jgi:hypothetical protein
LQSEYILYKHGPYSFDAEDMLAAMKVYHYIEEFDSAHFGRSFTQGHQAARLRKTVMIKHGDLKKIAKLCKLFDSNINIRELEGIATACWIRNNERIIEKDEIVKRLNCLKPHVSLKEAAQQASKLEALSLAMRSYWFLEVIGVYNQERCTHETF